MTETYRHPTTVATRSDSCNTHDRNGQVLVEFALIALVLYLLLAAILTFGHLLYVAQGLQTAADLGARETSRTPFSAFIEDPETGERPLRFDDLIRSEPSFPNEGNNALFRTRIFDDAWLVIDLESFFTEFPDGSVFHDLAGEMPLLNQQLLPLMIVDRPVIDGTQRHLLRYPGALLSRTIAIAPPADTQYPSSVETDFTVGIPLVVGRDADGVETIRWVPIVEEIGEDEPFRIDSPHHGIVALRINYPFQSAAMSSFRPNPLGPLEPTIGSPNVADDSSVEVATDSPPAPGALLDLPQIIGDRYAGTYGGEYGLGVQGAFGQMVRPYRRVISAQAIYRREIFE